MRRFIRVLILLLVPYSAHLIAQTTPSLSGQYFFNQASFATGSYPGSVAVADVNGDGRADVIVANQSGSSFSVLLGQAGGTLGLKTDVLLEEDPSALVTGDFNADGKLDVAVTQNSGVAVLLGNGDGTFKSPVTYATGTQPFLLAVLDLNGDGKSDLVAVGTLVTALLGKGDGTFQVQAGPSPGGFPWGFTVFDLNKDGIPDLAFANSPTNSVNGGTPGFVSVLIGNGDGTFKSPVNYTSGANIAGIAAGDVTGDGIPDLIVSHFFGYTVALLKGNGDGTFQAESGVSTDTSLGSQFLQLFDLNHDGKLDLVMSSVDNSGAAVLMGNGDGTFQSTQAYLTGTQPYYFTMGDVNGDGNVDLAMPDAYGNYVTILLGNGDGTFSPRTNLPLGASQNFINSAAIADFDGDGKLDIAVGTQPGLSVLPGNGDGTFKAPIVANSSNGLTLSQGAVGDFNKDGHLDLIANGTTLLLGKGDGNFETPVSVNSDLNIRSFVVGDFNNDGNPDILDVGNGFVESQPLQLLLGNGDGTFQTARRFWTLSGIPDKVAVGDFNHDGKLDLALTVNPNGIAILLGDGAGNFAAPVIYPTDDLPNSITVADLNHDGILDLVATGSKIDVFLGKGDGTFPNRVDYAIIGFPQQVATGDFNGDGKLDIAVDGYAADPGYLGILFGNGDGTFQNPIIVADNAPTGAPVLVSDLNGDGVDDALIPEGNGSLFLSAPVATVTPSILNFGTIYVGASPSLSILVTNSGNGPLNVSVPALAAPFSISGSVCQTPVPPLGNCTIPVVFEPTRQGGQIDPMQIHDNARNSKPVVLLAGTAVIPLLSIQAQTGGSTTATVASGSTANYALAVTAGPGFSGTVTFGCTGAPADAACTVSPSTMTLSSGGSGNFNVSVTTAQLAGLSVRGNVFGPIGGTGLLLSALLVPIVHRRSRTLAIVLCTIALVPIFAFSACGSGSGTSAPQQTTHNAAPGTYKLTVTASSGNTSSSQLLTLVIQ